MKKISLVLPVFNEETVLDELYDLVSKELKGSGYAYEIIFVNDGSRDRSRELIEGFCRQDKNTKLINFSRNFGHQPALMAGMENSIGDAVILMDADLQDKPKAIQSFLRKWEEGYQVVYAIRGSRKESIFQRALFSLFYRILHSSSRVFIPNDAGVFSLIDRRVVREIGNFHERSLYLPGLRAWAGFKQTGIVVEREARYDQKSRVGWLGLFHLAGDAIFSFSTLPLRIFLYIGILMFFIGFPGILLIIYLKLIANFAVPGWASTLTILIFSSSLNLLFLGAISEYLSRIYDEVKQRPRYIVESVINQD